VYFYPESSYRTRRTARQVTYRTQEAPHTAEIPDIKGWKFYIIIIIPLIAAIILLLIIGFPMPHLISPGPDNTPGAGNQTITGTPVPVRTTQVAPARSPSPAGTIPGVNTTLPASAVQTNQTSAVQTAVIIPVPFSLSVSPKSASARPGDTLTYTLEILHGEGLTGSIRMSLTAKVLFVTRTYDLGTTDPPFPKNVTYDFKVPEYLPSGTTVNGVITATGGSQTESEDISLNIL